MGNYVLTSSYDCTAKLWASKTWQPLGTLKGHDSRLMGCDISPNGNWVATCSYDRTFKLWSSEWQPLDEKWYLGYLVSSQDQLLITIQLTVLQPLMYHPFAIVRLWCEKRIQTNPKPKVYAFAFFKYFNIAFCFTETGWKDGYYCKIPGTVLQTPLCSARNRKELRRRSLDVSW